MTTDVILSLPKVPFVFSNSAARTSRTQVLVRAACVEAVRQAVLVVRVHEVLMTGLAELSIVAVPVAPTPEEPAVDFAGDQLLVSLSLVGVTAGSLLRGVLLTPLPTHLQVQARVSQPPTAQTIAATVGIELSGKM